MSTRCAIGLLRPNGTVLAIYCHHDGYPDGVGRCLLKAYTTEDRIRNLLELGAISSIGDNLSKEEGDDPCDPYCAGENPEISRIEVFPNKDWYQKEAPDHMCSEYLYLFENGRWFVYPVFHNNPMWYDLAENIDRKAEE